MRLRFYRTAEPGGGSGAAADPNAGKAAEPANQPGTPGTDSATDPNKSAAGAEVKPGGSGTGETSTQQPPAPKTLEEAMALYADTRKKLDEAEGRLAHKERSWQKKGQQLNALKRQVAEGGEEEIKPRGADGKYTPKDIEEANRRAYVKMQKEMALEQVTTEMEEYITEFADGLGLKEDAVKAADDLVTKYRRNFTLMEDEKDDAPVATEADMVKLMECVVIGLNHDQIVAKKVADAVAENDRKWTEKIAAGGAPEGSSLATKTLLNQDGQTKAIANPALRDVAESIKRIRAGAGA